MGPGTGLGQANLYWSENFGGYRVWPSEGAHASFAPRGWKQRALQTHVERQLGYCEVEHVSLSMDCLCLSCLLCKSHEAHVLRVWSHIRQEHTVLPHQQQIVCVCGILWTGA